MTPASVAAEPVAPIGHLHSNGDFCQERQIEPYPKEWPVPLYAAPTTVQPATLTDEQIDEIGIREIGLSGYPSDADIRAIVRACLAHAILAAAPVNGEK